MKRPLNLSNTAVERLEIFFNIMGDCFNILSNNISVLKIEVKSLKIPLLESFNSNNFFSKLFTAQ